MPKRIVLTILVAVGALLAWVVWTGAVAFLRAPGMVADLERAGGLPLSPSDLPKSRVCALLAVDDPTFYLHQGIGLFDGPPGHTTITQAIGKGLFFNGFDPGFLRHRKIRLMVAAWAFDRRISKEMQLRVFLNRAYFGSMDERGVLGFPAAARAYFGKPLDRVSDREYLGLLAMLEAPSRYHVQRQPQANAERVARLEMRIKEACREGCFEGESPIPCPGSPSSH